MLRTKLQLLATGLLLLLPTSALLAQREVASAGTSSASALRYTRGPDPLAGTRVSPLDAMRERPMEFYEKPSEKPEKESVPKPEKPAPIVEQPPASAQQVYNPGIPRKASGTPLHPLKRSITSTVFWIGEMPSGRNKVPNHKSSWDGNWMQNYGGYDDPNPSNRINYRPKGFIPKLNSFYVALPYNDVMGYARHKAEASRVIPWFKTCFSGHGKTVCKGRWVAIRYGSKVCFAQWEDCGPFETNDWQYVFGNSRPKTPHNKGAGIDVSPAVRDFLGIQSGAKVDWRFVEAADVAPGPWRLYGQDKGIQRVAQDSDAQKKADMDRLYKAREEWLRRQSLPR